MEWRVSVVILTVDVEAISLDQEVDQMLMTPESGLVKPIRVRVSG